MYLPHTARPEQAGFPLATREEECGFEGNPDLYGLGIRLGIYMQWLSALLVRTFHPKGIRGLTDTYIIFIFAIFVAILVITVQNTPTHTAEMLVLTYIIFGGVYAIMWSTGKPRKITQIDRETVMWVVRRLVFMCTIGAVASYCCWFWLRGMYGQSFRATPCGSYGFLFAKVSLYNRHVTQFFAFLSIALILSFTINTANLLLELRRYKLTSGAQSAPSRQPSQNHESMNLPILPETTQPKANEPTRQHGRSTKNQRTVRRKERKLERRRLREEGRSPGQKFLSFIAPYIRICSLVYAVLGIELTLHWNGVTGVYSVNTVGQLIPFTIGVCGLIQMIYIPLVDRLVKSLEVRERSRDGRSDPMDGVVMDESVRNGTQRNSGGSVVQN